MLLSRALAHETTNSVRTKGAQYFQSGAVVHFDPQASMVYAVVRGNDDYVVRMELAGKEVRCTCTCPYFNDRLDPCKHLWAVALSCDAKSVLQPPDNLQPSQLIFVAVPLEDEDEDWSLDEPEFRRPRSHAGSLWSRGRRRTQPPAPEPWQIALANVTASSSEAIQPAVDLPPGQILYVVDLAGSRHAGALVVHLLRQERKQNGEWGVPKALQLNSIYVKQLHEVDRTLLERVSGGRPLYGASYGYAAVEVASPFQMRGALLRDLLPVMCETSRCRLALTAALAYRPQDSPLIPLVWDAARSSSVCVLRVDRVETEGVFIVDAGIQDGELTIPLSKVQLMLDDGVAVVEGTAFAVDLNGLSEWVRQLSQHGPLRVPLAQLEGLRRALLVSGAAGSASLPPELHTEIVDTSPTPILHLDSQPHQRQLLVELLFSYADGPPVPQGGAMLLPTGQSGVMTRRAIQTEASARARLEELGVRSSWSPWTQRPTLQLPPSEIPRLVRALVPEGWRVEADGRRFRLPGSAPLLAVTSGIDWFEVRGLASFDGEDVALPALLKAIERRDGTIALGDGTVGVLPEEWLRQLGTLTIGERTGDHVRFKRTQVALLDAMLESRPEVSWDDTAGAARDRLRHFERISPQDPPASFVGALREYQREGLGWLTFLREFGFGGCLADDMGLGKTVVVLGLLEARRQERAHAGVQTQPSLIVVPRSVLFNWQQEARRFTPDLRLLDFSDADRKVRSHLIAESDAVLVTYGTLRRDAPALADVVFDYVVLDEAQTIKNANTAVAKAARLLRSEHKLALSGTPVENRLADLWSIFEFLNPGLLGASSGFGRSFTGSGDADEVRLLGQGLRPFILRRTKEQVASELPAKTEQTIVCELERPQRALYDELRDHYRKALLGRPGVWQRSKLQVLEALLRLRQAACHPALVDPKRASDASAKLDLLLPRLVETIEEGHKALVFSQFTSFLALLRKRLDAQSIEYEYLDGKVHDREARVERFQTDKSCPLFLISLKAGGVGLNLTAADYVFILDPWWNPAAEAQAVDRTHRIGQTKNVFAYRLIAKDTVEERVLELQQQKRDLAEAIITADNSLIRQLQREDLERLLS